MAAPLNHRAQLLERDVEIELAVAGEGAKPALLPAITRPRPTMLANWQIL
jgi:hypothetical protein